MKLKKLIESIEGLEIRGSKEVEIVGLSASSKLIAPGFLFIAKKGLKHDGSDFINEAAGAGAVAILTDIYDPFLPLTQLIHKDVSSIEAVLAARFYQNPSKEIKVVGVTGTNGKTTTSFLIQHMLEKLEVKTGLIGTIEWMIGSHRFQGSMTTPDVITNHKLLREMVMEGCRAAVMEVSSHGLSQKRTSQIDFDIALFTNLSEEHLDYHGDMLSYANAKGKLFSSLEGDKWALLNNDESHKFQTRANVFTYGIENPSDLMAKNLHLSETKTRFTLVYGNEQIECRSSLIGKFNVYNTLGAIATCICMGKPLKDCVQALKFFKGVPGRMQRVKNNLGLNVFVDFAHSPDALENVLKSLNYLKKGKVIAVFGAGGDRDKEKRPLMGEVASEHCDVAIITSDNPRSEDPQIISDQILQGFSDHSKAIIELDREKAIKKAIELASPKDIILIAGKGHEKHQIFAHKILPFDDVEITQKICHEREGVCG